MEEHDLLYAENMILIGASGRNTGKTAMAVRLIQEYSREQPVVGIKVITVHNHGDICPRGGKGCGICIGLKTCFDIREETEEGGKDTMLFKKAGARAVYLVRAYPEGLKEAMEQVIKMTTKADKIICESNSVRNVLKPGYFYMVRDSSQEIKESAGIVMKYADEILEQSALHTSRAFCGLGIRK